MPGGLPSPRRGRTDVAGGVSRRGRADTPDRPASSDPPPPGAAGRCGEGLVGSRDPAADAAGYVRPPLRGSGNRLSQATESRCLGIAKLEALRWIMQVAERAPFQFAFSDNSFAEVEPRSNVRYLRWAYDVLDHRHACLEESGELQGDPTALAENRFLRHELSGAQEMADPEGRRAL